ncbi:MAG: hypothetical protein U5Q03_18110 [Bacteroidota bacterium]|nr:hypothetical protein [Bacteroidota bacterium]
MIGLPSIPKRTSNEKDIWGFYKSGVTSSIPNIYVYRSALPAYKKFKLYPNSNFGYEVSLVGIQIDYRMKQAKMSRVATLNKVIFPSGGYKRFEFEHNSFLLDNEEEIGAGIRISKIYVCEDGIPANKRLVSESTNTMNPGSQGITSGDCLENLNMGFLIIMSLIRIQLMQMLNILIKTMLKQILI